MSSDLQKSKAIVFFDGHCGLCSSFVNFLLSVDAFDRLQFATLQGQTAKNNLPAETLTKLESVIVLYNGTVYEKSDAVLIAFSQLNPLSKVFMFLGLLPKNFRNWFYDLVAKHRYKIFGYKEICRVPTEKEKAKFID